MADSAFPTTDGEQPIDDKANNPPPPYQAVSDSSKSPSKMENKSLSSINGDKTALKDVTVETPTGDSSISSKSKKCCRAKVYFISISLVLGAGLISALIYFILLHANAEDPDPSKSMAQGTTEAMRAGAPTGGGQRHQPKTEPSSDNSVCCFNPCMNSGVCREANDTDPVPFACECTKHYEGIICENRKFVDMCVRNPCNNGGTCSNTDTFPFHSCSCTSNYNGDFCEQRKTFNQAVHTSSKLPSCTPTFCKNGGTCSVFRTSLTCACAEGYTGDKCAEIEATTATAAATSTASTTTATTANGSYYTRSDIY